ncbi:hypothetical protein BCR33DRAFT_416709 [Rhizoclosmatium globosum]|uniref:Uncharacterized protein n=1 Tax=Rhizoclosmatium globosum TaxID=329046 RepID=A0A1Y2BWB1_9FUNG|nr:hypothetical protein BCR33DRAFT_416709 [Rhizoclosmatium globosum]|eukprot:ORY39041.1 hypothetical protein BCR33DRAFT_416709 [Rhizoclosmatium globosum]
MLQQIRFEKEKKEWINDQNVTASLNEKALEEEAQILQERIKNLESELHLSRLEAAERLDEAVGDLNTYKADCLETYLFREQARRMAAKIERHRHEQVVKSLHMELHFCRLEWRDQLSKATCDMNTFKADCLETYLYREKASREVTRKFKYNATALMLAQKRTECSRQEVSNGGLSLHIEKLEAKLQEQQNEQAILLQEAESQILKIKSSSKSSAIALEESNETITRFEAQLVKVRNANEELLIDESDVPKRHSRLSFKSMVDVVTTYSIDEYPDRKVSARPLVLSQAQWYCMLAEKRQMGVIIPCSPSHLYIDAFETENFGKCPMSKSQMQEMLRNLRGMCKQDSLESGACKYLEDMDTWVSTHCKNTTDFDFLAYESSMDDVEQSIARAHPTENSSIDNDDKTRTVEILLPVESSNLGSKSCSISIFDDPMDTLQRGCQ